MQNRILHKTSRRVSLLVMGVMLMHIQSVFGQHDIDTIKHLEHYHVFSQKKNHSEIATNLSTILLDETYLEENASNNLVNTLEKVPGFRALQTGSSIAKPSLRGFSQNRLVMLEYGVKHEGQQWGLEHGLELDGFLVERLEILKGPASILYGSDAIGGVIQVLNPIIPRKDTIQTTLMSGFRSNDLAASFGIRNLWVKKDFFLLSKIKYENFGSYQTTRHFFETDGQHIDLPNRRLPNSGGETFTAAIQTGIRKDWGFSNLNFSYNNQNLGLYHLDSHEEDDHDHDHDHDHGEKEVSRKYDLPYQQTQHFKVVSNTHFHLGETNVELDLAYQVNQRKEFEAEHGEDDHDHDHDHDEEALKLVLHTYSAALKFKYFLNDNWNFTYGVQSSYQVNKRGGHEYLLADYSNTQVGLFALANYHINTRLDAQFALRGDYIKQSASAAFDQGVLLSEKFSKDRTMFAFSTGLKWDLSEHWQVKYNLGSAYRFPQMVELTANGIHHGALRHEMGNSNLGIESGLQNDLSLHFEKEKWKLHFSPFLNSFSNFIYLQNTGLYSSIDSSVFVYQYAQAAVLFAGAELHVAYQISPKLKSETGLEYVYNRSKATNRALPFTPPFSLVEELSLKPFSGNMKRVFFSLTGHYFAAQNRVDLNEQTTAAYFLLHLSVGNTFKFNKSALTTQLNVRNLTNQYYLNNMSQYRAYNIPEQGINVQVSLKYTF